MARTSVHLLTAAAVAASLAFPGIAHAQPGVALVSDTVRAPSGQPVVLNALGEHGLVLGTGYSTVPLATREEQHPSPIVPAARSRYLAEIAEGKSNNAIADSLVLTKRAVEKHINSIFMKLGLGDADDISKRVKATLMFLAETKTAPSP